VVSITWATALGLGGLKMVKANAVAGSIRSSRPATQGRTRLCFMVLTTGIVSEFNASRTGSKICEGGGPMLPDFNLPVCES
jgi:hypothetical protein